MIETKSIKTLDAYKLMEATAPHAEDPKRAKTGLDVAIKARDWDLTAEDLKKRASGKSEADAVVDAVNRIEGRHTEMTDVIPELTKTHPEQALLLRKALSHKYQWLKFALLGEQQVCNDLIARAGLDRTVTPMSIDLCQAKVEALRSQVAELTSVDAVVNFTAVSAPFLPRTP
jgi:hypothetical protein